MIQIYGIDPSLKNTGIAHIFYNDLEGVIENVAYSSYSPAAKTTAKKLVEINNFIDKFLKSKKYCNYTYAGIENPVLGKHFNIQSLISLCYVGGIVRHFFANLDINILEISPSELKKAATGKGNADKKLVRNMLKGMFPQFIKANINDDESDAVAAAYYVLISIKAFMAVYKRLPGLLSSELQEFIEAKMAYKRGKKGKRKVVKYKDIQKFIGISEKDIL